MLYASVFSSAGGAVSRRLRWLDRAIVHPAVNVDHEKIKRREMAEGCLLKMKKTKRAK